MSKKIVGAAFATALAASIALPAAAHNPNNPPRVGILPAALAPVGVAAWVGPSTSILHKNFSFWKWKGSGWAKVHSLKKAGWNVDITKKFKGKKIKVHAEKKSSSRMKQGKAVVGCVMGSALGAITSSVRKASAMGNPPRWRSQAEHERIVASGYEKQFELTSDEAALATAFCGLGSFALHWPQGQPAVQAVPARF